MTTDQMSNSIHLRLPMLLPLVFPALFSSLFPSALSETTCSAHHTNGVDDDNDSLHQFKLRVAHLESILSENIQLLNEKIVHIEEREKRIEEMAQKIHDLQSVLFTLKQDSMRAEEMVSALEEEVRLLWAASRKYNFDLHVLESKAQDAEDRVEMLTSQAQKMADVVTERWIQIQRLEQALHIAQVRTMRAQRQGSSTKCIFLKFTHNLVDDPLLKNLGCKLRSYSSQALLLLGRVYAEVFPAITRSHHELQYFIKAKLEQNGFSAALANEELVFLMATVVIASPVIGAYILVCRILQAETVASSD